MRGKYLTSWVLERPVCPDFNGLSLKIKTVIRFAFIWDWVFFKLYHILKGALCLRHNHDPILNDLLLNWSPRIVVRLVAQCLAKTILKLLSSTVVQNKQCYLTHQWQVCKSNCVKAVCRHVGDLEVQTQQRLDGMA